ncbi:Rv0361 family membrane protein [Symbioplanes lichenis]|uniref:Rv0361 family membrane protein n=1 Tax=Symbioplanes lichenis TaxID=1629072 RepID=UPI002738E610|nr:hypothetical protein [Actinoplanes lichenis]
MTQQPSPDDGAWPSSVAAAQDPPLDTPASPPEWPPLGAYPEDPVPPAHAYAPLEYYAEAYDDDRSTDQFPAVPADAAEFPAVPADAVEVSGIPPDAVEGEVVWHQPPPVEPFHAKHEKPGEWHTHPPDHLAFHHSPPAEVQPGVQHDQPTEAIPLRMLPQPWEVPFDPQHAEPHPAPPPPRQRRTGRWVALAVVLTLLILAGGAVSAILLLRDADSGKGSPDPATAVDRFMTEVYTRQDATSAAEHVCREARDATQLTSRVAEIEGYATEYPAPVFAWNEPSVRSNTGDKALVDVQLTMTTDDERAARQQLTFTVVRKTGWLVCDVNSRA